MSFRDVSIVRKFNVMKMNLLVVTDSCVCECRRVGGDSCHVDKQTSCAYAVSLGHDKAAGRRHGSCNAGTDLHRVRR